MEIKEYFIVISCVNCDADIRQRGVWVGDDLIEFTPSSITYKTLYCDECGKKTYTGDLDILSEDEV